MLVKIFGLFFAVRWFIRWITIKISWDIILIVITNRRSHCIAPPNINHIPNEKLLNTQRTCLQIGNFFLLFFFSLAIKKLMKKETKKKNNNNEMKQRIQFCFSLSSLSLSFYLCLFLALLLLYTDFFLLFYLHPVWSVCGVFPFSGMITFFFLFDFVLCSFCEFFFSFTLFTLYKHRIELNIYTPCTHNTMWIYGRFSFLFHLINSNMQCTRVLWIEAGIGHCTHGHGHKCLRMEMGGRVVIIDPALG